MSDPIDIQHACALPLPIADETLKTWVKLALKGQRAELTLRFVDIEEITTLNHTYRKKNKATNVLAFPARIPPEVHLDDPLLGDVVICPEVLELESEEQQIAIDAHFAHIVLHGVLHLLGYDHETIEDAKIMQTLEIDLLATLSFPNPYKDSDFE